MLQLVGNYSTQPVVGVDGIDAALGLDMGEHTIGELLEYLTKGFFGEMMRPSIDMDDAMTRFDEDLWRQTGAVGPGIGGAFDTGLR